MTAEGSSGSFAIPPLSPFLRDDSVDPAIHNTAVVVLILLLSAWAGMSLLRIANAMNTLEFLLHHKALMLEGMGSFSEDLRFLLRIHVDEILRLKANIPPIPIAKFLSPAWVHPSSVQISPRGSSSSDPNPTTLYRFSFQFDAAVPCTVQLIWGASLQKLDSVITQARESKKTSGGLLALRQSPFNESSSGGANLFSIFKRKVVRGSAAVRRSYRGGTQFGAAGTNSVSTASQLPTHSCGLPSPGEGNEQFCNNGGSGTIDGGSEVVGAATGSSQAATGFIHRLRVSARQLLSRRSGGGNTRRPRVHLSSGSSGQGDVTRSLLEVDEVETVSSSNVLPIYNCDASQISTFPPFLSPSQYIGQSVLFPYSAGSKQNFSIDSFEISPRSPLWHLFSPSTSASHPLNEAAANSTTAITINDTSGPTESFDVTSLTTTVAASDINATSHNEGNSNRQQQETQNGTRVVDQQFSFSENTGRASQTSSSSHRLLSPRAGSNSGSSSEDRLSDTVPLLIVIKRQTDSPYPTVPTSSLMPRRRGPVVSSLSDAAADKTVSYSAPLSLSSQRLPPQSLTQGRGVMRYNDGTESLIDETMESRLCQASEDRLISGEAHLTVVRFKDLIPEVVKQMVVCPSHGPQEAIEIFGLEDQNDKDCLICMSNRKDAILLPCRHCSSCHQCLRSLRQEKCPICRSGFTAFVTLPFNNQTSPSSTHLPQSTPTPSPPSPRSQEVPPV